MEFDLITLVKDLGFGGIAIYLLLDGKAQRAENRNEREKMTKIIADNTKAVNSVVSLINRMFEGKEKV